jgi:hypothetical protein
MNTFAAHVILCQVGVDEFLEMSPQEREVTYGLHIGIDRMVCLVYGFLVTGSADFQTETIEHGHSTAGGGDCFV